MTGLLKRTFLRNRIRKRMILFFGLTTLLMFAVNLYTYYNARALALNMKDMFMSNIYLNELNGNIDRLQSSLKNYLYTRHSESFNEYSRYSGLLSNIPQEEQSEFFSAESLLLLDDIDNMVVTYLAEAEASVNAKRGRDINECSLHFTEATKVFSYINLYINKLKLGQFEENVNGYKLITGRLNIIQILNIVIILAAVVINILLILNFTFRLTKPIISLANSANEIYKGNFNVSLVEVDADDEIKMMADAFNSMASSIKGQVDAIKGRAELEGLLKEQEMQNLLMKNLLKEAELQALQSQINPHFIYNTLNAGVQLAVLEDAERTGIYIENVANLFRYNMNMIDRPVTLGDEIKNVRSYMHILKVRFASRIKFVQQVDESALGIRMPCMILQPLVENAYIHGIGPVILNRIVVYIPVLSTEDEYSQRLEAVSIAEYAFKKLSCRVDADLYIGIGRLCKGVENLAGSYEDTLRAIRYADGKGVIHIKDIPAGDLHNSGYPAIKEKLVIEKASTGEIQGCIQAFNHIFEWQASEYGGAVKQVKERLVELIVTLHRLAWDYGIEEGELLRRQDYLSEMFSINELSALKVWCVRRIEHICRGVNKLRKKRLSNIISNAVGFIDTNFSRELTLEDVSREVKISPYYFSKLFKEETGENFIDYLTMVRVNKAKDFLEHGLHSVKEICYNVGYSDPNYFSRLFKKVVGLTPTEYKDKIVKY